jgi:hypothetical protein
MAAYHPIFDRFPPFEGVVPAGFTADFSGVLVDPRMFDPEASAPAEPRFMRIGTPSCTGEGYFDLIALAHAVDAARERFVMIELGAGYGYWLSEGVVWRVGAALPRSWLGSRPIPDISR